MKSFFSILNKVIIAVGLSYLICMVICTVMKKDAMVNRMEWSISRVAQDLKKDARNYYLSEEFRENGIPFQIDANQKLAEYQKEEDIPVVTVIYKENEIIQQTGKYLYRDELEQELNRSHLVIDLEKWLSNQEIAQLIAKKYDIEGEENQESLLRVTGILNDEIIVPQNIALYQKKSTGEEKLVLEFPIKIDHPDSKVISTSWDGWDISIPVFYHGQGERWLIKEFKQLAYIKEVMGESYESYSDGITEIFNEVIYGGIFFPEDERMDIEYTYKLKIALTFKPWNKAIEEMKRWYILSAFLVIVMSSILSTGLYMTEKKREQLENNRRQLIDVIGHELKTPLAIIRSYSEGLKENIAVDKEAHYIEVIEEETKRIRELIEEMNMLSSLEENTYELLLEDFSVKTLVEELLKNKERWLEEKKLIIQIDVGDIWIQADYKSISWALHNLIVNAIRYANIGSVIQIGYHNQRFYVQNQGPTIPKKEIKKIWEAFYKVAGGDHRTGKETGLGLAIVAQTCQRHHLTYGVENKSDGVCFWIQGFVEKEHLL